MLYEDGASVTWNISSQVIVERFFCVTPHGENIGQCCQTPKTTDIMNMTIIIIGSTLPQLARLIRAAITRHQSDINNRNGNKSVL